MEKKNINNLNTAILNNANILNSRTKNSQERDYKAYSIELESQVNLLKKKILVIENTQKNSIIENPNFAKLNSENLGSLYETILIYIKNINIQHLLEIFNLHLQKEEEITKVIDLKKIPSASDFGIRIKNLSEKLFHLTKHCELAFNDYENRSKAYLSIEDLERKVVEFNNFIELNLNNFLNLLVNNMINNNESVVFKLNHKDYNQALESISVNLESFNRLNQELIDNYKTNFYALQTALDIIQKQAKIEYENVKNIIYDTNLKLI